MVLYDWVSVTSKIHSVQDFIAMLGLPGEVSWQTITGQHGYRDRLYWEGISIHFNGRDDMGIWLEMSGKGCRTFETYGSGNYELWFDEVLQNPEEMNLTRLDIAYDDHEGLLNMRELERDTRELSFVSKWREREVIWDHKDENDIQGMTIFHGRKKSDAYLRIYDKAAERGYTDRHWVRLELVLKDDRARAWIADTTPIGEKLAGVLRNYLRYVDPGTDSNRWRWPMKAYWEQLLAGAERIRLYNKPGAEYNLSQLERFVYQQAGGAITALLQIAGEQRFLEELRKNRPVLNQKYVQLIGTYAGDNQGGGPGEETQE